LLQYNEPFTAANLAKKMENKKEEIRNSTATQQNTETPSKRLQNSNERDRH